MPRLTASLGVLLVATVGTLGFVAAGQPATAQPFDDKPSYTVGTADGTTIVGWPLTAPDGSSVVVVGGLAADGTVLPLADQPFPEGTPIAVEPANPSGPITALPTSNPGDGFTIIWPGGGSTTFLPNGNYVDTTYVKTSGPNGITVTITEVTYNIAGQVIGRFTTSFTIPGAKFIPFPPLGGK